MVRGHEVGAQQGTAFVTMRGQPKAQGYFRDERCEEQGDQRDFQH